jgi:hypothetical protein
VLTAAALVLTPLLLLAIALEPIIRNGPW